MVNLSGKIASFHLTSERHCFTLKSTLDHQVDKMHFISFMDVIFQQGNSVAADKYSNMENMMISS